MIAKFCILFLFFYAGVDHRFMHFILLYSTMIKTSIKIVRSRRVRYYHFTDVFSAFYAM